MDLKLVPNAGTYRKQLRIIYFLTLGDSNNNANRRNTDSTSHTDGASTPEVVSLDFYRLGLVQKASVEHGLTSRAQKPG